MKLVLTPAVISAIFSAPIAWADDAATSRTTAITGGEPGVIYALLFAVIAFTGVLIVYVWTLRNQTIAQLNKVGSGDNLASALNNYYNLPLGVPRGTVRAVLALLIVCGSIAFLGVSMRSADYKFPDALTGILGAILGFYFGKGTGTDDGTAVNAVVAANADARDAKDKAEAATAQAADAQTKADTATQALGDMQAQHDELASGHLDRITNDLQSAVGVGQALASVLPGNFGKVVGEATGALSGTLSAVADLRKGDLVGAVQQATALVDQSAPGQPVASVLSKALEMIGPALGGSFPPLALITTLVGIGGKLSAAAYARWVARVMDAPYTPEQFAAAVFDSNSAGALILQCPSMMTAFGQKIAAGDRALALDVVKLALGTDGGAGLVAKYPDAFAGMAQQGIDQAVRELQKAALDSQLIKDLPKDVAAAQGGPASVLQAIDKIRADRQASAGLDAVMTTVAALKRAGKNPETEFNAAAQAIGAKG